MSSSRRDSRHRTHWRLFVYVWYLCWSVATMFLYWFEKLTNVISDPSWSYVQQSKYMFFLDISISPTAPLVVMIYGAVCFHLAIPLVTIVSICVLFISIIRHEEWTFSHCLGLGHEHCYALCSPMFFNVPDFYRNKKMGCVSQQIFRQYFRF